MLHKQPLPLAIRAILGSDSNTQETPFGSAGVLKQNGSRGEWEGLLTLFIVAPAVNYYFAPPLSRCAIALEETEAVLSWGGAGVA